MESIDSMRPDKLEWARNTLMKTNVTAPQITPSERFWLGFAILTVCLIVTSSVVWMHNHPFGINWDETEYFDRILSDVHRLKEGGILQLINAYLTEDIIRPPARKV